MEQSLEPCVPETIRSRGNDYFRRGRVRRVALHSPGSIDAYVQGSELYHVRLEFEDASDQLLVACTCPWYLEQLTVCKHVWAAIRSAGYQRLLPNRELYIDSPPSNQTAGSSPSKNQSQQRDAIPQWQRVIDALHSHPTQKRQVAPTLPDEIIYVLRVTTATFALQIMSRTRKKNGEWSKWKPLALTTDHLQFLPEPDRTTMSLLQRPYSYVVESTTLLPSATIAWWVERLARTNQLALQRHDGEMQRLSWDDGPPWTLRIAIKNDAGEKKYRIEALIAREGESMPLDNAVVIAPTLLFSNNVASRFDDGGRSDWLRVLQGVARVEVPHADTAAFREALRRVPLANIELPEELGWSVVQVEPHPILSLQHVSSGSELGGELSFRYDDWRVSSRSAEMQHAAGRKLIQRDRDAEEPFRAQLISLGVVSTWEGYRIRAGQFESVVRQLAEDGWTIEIDSAPVRAADDLAVEITSGIDWFDLDLAATFGNLRAGMPELLAAAEAQRSLMRLSDGSWGIVPRGWTDSLAPVLDLGKRTGDAMRFPNVQALLVNALLAGNAPKTDAAFQKLREQFIDAKPEPRNEPPTLRAELRPYQRAGLGWMHFLRETGIGGCLADDMGLGKTVQTLAMLEELRAAGCARPSLVVAPRSLLFNWAAEAKRFAPELRVVEYHGSERTLEALQNCDLLLTTYATMRLDIAQLSAIEFEYVILDEAQAIKTATSQVAKASQSLRGRHRLALSGTPIENHLGEIWSLFEFLNPGLLGGLRLFNRTFAGKTTPPERREALARALRPMILRRTKEQVAPELPERIEQTLYCELDETQRRQYDELRDHYRNAILGTVRENGLARSRMQILEALLRLRQAACHPALVNKDSDAPSAKLDLLLEELYDVLESGHRALVFSQFTSFLDLACKRLDARRLEYLYLDGKTRDRQSLVDRFQSNDGPPLFLISLKAGGLGLNLTNADYIFLLDPWWNPAVEAQAIDRAHRIGRRKPVMAYRMIARDTVEEKILELQAQKRELAESILSEDNSVLRKLELEDLEMLLG